MEKIRKILQKKIVLFLIQFIILSVVIFSSGYYFVISFDSGITIERQIIIQFLANYVMFGSFFQFFFLGCTWLIIILIPIFLLNNYRKSATMNLATFFFPNFFFYVFLSRYSINYYNSNMPILLFKTILLGVIIVLVSLSGTFILKRIVRTDKSLGYRDLDQKNYKIEYKCVKCGTEFKSLPKYCYNCLNKIIEENQIND